MITDTSGTDTLSLERYSANEIAFYMDDKDLVISAGTDSLRIKDQKTDDGHAVDRFVLSNGKEISGTGIDSLISAMATFGANNSVTIASAQNVRDNAQLMSLAASAWQ